VIAHIPGRPPRAVRHLHRLGARRARVRRRPGSARRGSTGLINFFVAEVGRRKDEPGHDLLSELLHTEMDGELIDPAVVLGIASLVLIAGVDTTWSAIGSSLWHLATHDEDRKRMVSDPAVWPLAIEELLRAYSPVTMAREVTEDVVYAGCPMAAGDKVLMNFPAANRDPEIFEDADTVVLDRALNRHVAFGSGHPPLRRLQSGPHGASGGPGGVAAAGPRVPCGRGCHGHVGGRPGARPALGPGGVSMRIRVDEEKCQGHARCYGFARPSLTSTTSGCPGSLVTGRCRPSSKVRPAWRLPTAPSSPSKSSVTD